MSKYNHWCRYENFSDDFFALPELEETSLEDLSQRFEINPLERVHYQDDEEVVEFVSLRRY